MIAGGADPRFAADMARSAARSSVADEIALDEDGTPLTEVRYYKRADGKPLVKNQKNRVIVPPGPPMPDETGVTHDGGGRVGSSVEVQEAETPAKQEPDTENGQAITDTHEEVAQTEQPISPDYSDEELAAIERELAAATDEPVNDAVEPAPAVDGDPEPVSEQGENALQDENVVQDTPPREEPETDERKLIAAE
jgi:hypothetical protein